MLVLRADGRSTKSIVMGKKAAIYLFEYNNIYLSVCFLQESLYFIDLNKYGNQKKLNCSLPTDHN